MDFDNLIGKAKEYFDRAEPYKIEDGKLVKNDSIRWNTTHVIVPIEDFCHMIRAVDLTRYFLKINKEKAKNVGGRVSTRIYELLGEKYTHIFYRIDSFKVATHELFHLSTPGFRDLNDSFRGQGLNEGYTELLNRRYFNIQYDNSYIIETKIE